MPPPGFGPKVDKKRQEEEKKLIPESERYSIRLDPHEDTVLREVLHAAERCVAGKRQRLLRDQKRLHQLYQHLVRLGFSTGSVEQCLPHIHAEGTLADALDWCCLHLPEVELPPAFKVSRIGEGNDEESTSSAQLPPSRGPPKAPAIPVRVVSKMAEREAARAAAAVAARARDKAAATAAGGQMHSAAEFNKRLVAQMMEGGSSEEEEELTDALGILELDELDDATLNRLKEEKAKAAQELRGMADARPYRIARLERHAAQIEEAIDARLPKHERQRKEGLKRRAAAQAARLAAAKAREAEAEAPAPTQIEDAAENDDEVPHSVPGFAWGADTSQKSADSASVACDENGFESERVEDECDENERVENERAELERIESERAEQERIEHERAEHDRAEKARAEHERIEKERAELERAELERAELERAEREREECEAREAREREARERETREAHERAEREEYERAERVRIERECAERERIERERDERGRAERERAERERAERVEQEKIKRAEAAAASESDFECKRAEAAAASERERSGVAADSDREHDEPTNANGTNAAPGSKMPDPSATVPAVSASSKSKKNKKKTTAGAGSGGNEAKAAAARAAALARYQTTSVQKPVQVAAAPASSTATASTPASATPGCGSRKPSEEAYQTVASSSDMPDGGPQASSGSKGGDYDLSGWGGKTPKTMLFEWFQKRQQPRPKIEVEMAGRRYRGVVTVQGGIVYQLPPDESFDKRDGAEQAAATMALLQLFPDQPLYRLLPPAYRTLWLKWADQAKVPQQQEAAAALVARDRFIKSLCDRSRQPSEPLPRPRVSSHNVDGTYVGEPVDEIAAARARQLAAEREDEREALEEEERERQAAAAEQEREHRVARGLQMQVAYERWRASDEGQAHEKFRTSLPISQLQGAIKSSMERSQVALICGETGSGKSTQVPQILLEQALAAGHGGSTSIICTQPRRIAATSLARRVAQERSERIGERGSFVGYQVRMESKRTDSTRLLFCTTGIALRMMLSDPPLHGISHVVVDEVHERDAQTDQLLLLLRELLPSRPDLKVVLMSATVQAETFSKYFDGCEILTSKGRTFPVEEHYLENVLHITGHVLPADSICRLRNTGDWQKQSFAVHNRTITQEWQHGNEGVNPEYTDARYAEWGEGVCNVLRVLNEHAINYDLIFDLVSFIDENHNDGAILVFLPGLVDITTLLSMFSADRRFNDSRRFRVLPLHSSLSPTEQAAVFEQMPQGVRKVVLATNIAETSITIDDAVFVIDSGRAKQMLFNEQKQMRRLVDVWISQAEARQRAGRAGRVRSGHVFKLYTRHRSMVHMSQSRLPEMLRGPLQEICLQLRLAPLLEEMDLRSAFAKALSPPPENTVSAAVSGLQRCGALDEAEQLTPLGRHLAALPVDIGVGRLILYGALLRCAQPILLIAAALSDRSPFISPIHKREEAKLMQATFNTSVSDHLAVVEAHRRWEDVYRNSGRAAASRFCEKHFLSERVLQGMTDMASQFWDQLASVGLLPRLKGLTASESEEVKAAANRNADNMELLKAVLCAGLFPNVLRATHHGIGKGGVQLTQHKQMVSIHPSSFNKTVQKFDSGWLVYHEKVATGKIFVHDVTAVTSLDIFLFGAEPQVLHAQHKVIIDGWIDMRISPRTAVLFKSLRKQLSELMALRIAVNDGDGNQSAWKRELVAGSMPGEAGWPPPMETIEQAQAALLTALVWLISKGMDLQADGQTTAAAAAAAIRRGSSRR